ncbi:MAG TPA: hypothetical protein VK458_11510, partial [Myxococcaceae bacterium]|nr:hypothetical protein [Myxococcaceae bacterium]
GPAWRTLSRRTWSRAALGGLVGLYALSSVAAATVQLPAPIRREQLEALVFAGQDRTLTGLLVAGQQEWNVSCRFYLRRDVPLLVRPVPQVHELEAPLTDPGFSHVIVVDSVLGDSPLERAGFCRLRRWGPTTLWRRCALTG